MLVPSQVTVPAALLQRRLRIKAGTALWTCDGRVAQSVALGRTALTDPLDTPFRLGHAHSFLPRYVLISLADHRHRISTVWLGHVWYDPCCRLAVLLWNADPQSAIVRSVLFSSVRNLITIYRQMMGQRNAPSYLFYYRYYILIGLFWKKYLVNTYS